ncbi:MAG: type II/IV secretion system ATPase subunit [archaeon]
MEKKEARIKPQAAPPSGGAIPKTSVANTEGKPEDEKQLIDTYDFISNKIPISVRIYNKHGDFVPTYAVSISSISRNTEIILEKIRYELISQVSLGIADITQSKETDHVEEKFRDAIEILVRKHFPDADESTTAFLVSYLIQRSLGMGNVEILMSDEKLEEVAINSSDDPVWVYHRKHGWLRTNVVIDSEETTRHYAATIGRRIGRQISVLEPLLDAYLNEGDRANATLMPISTHGNTLTLRKYSRDPFTITHFLRHNTINTSAAAFIWLGIQYELSAIIAGGTASGKTATLNVLASFIPPNQRILSIEDTRELRLPKFLHWVPMSTRLPNPEGKGGISMADLLINSLRMRPDRILVGEVRRQREAETLFEAIHTGHSCYATFHANNADETIKRLTNPPVNVPESVLPAINMLITQFRNRRTGLRRTFQIAEITPDAKCNILQQYDPKRDILQKVGESKTLMDTLRLYTGYTRQEITNSVGERERILKYLVKQDIDHVDEVGRIIAEFYKDKDRLMRYVDRNRPFTLDR